jgi:hypothetical protein
MNLMKAREIASVYQIVPRSAPNNDRHFWLSQSPAERIAALERIRSEYHTWKNDAEPGFQRVYQIIKRK